MRINKFFTEFGFSSRREADRYVEEGRVKINSRVAKLGEQVSDEDRVYLDEVELKRPQKKKAILLAFNKPPGVECTSDPDVENNIIEAVNYPERVFHIGRLDKYSEGLILLTNLGDIVNAILRSRHEHEKEYVVVVDKEISPALLRAFRQGVDIGDERPTKPCRVTQMGNNRVKMILTEGRNRQIRRMFQMFDYKVVRLKRTRVMNITLGSLPSGHWRELSDQEQEQLQSQLRAPPV